MYVHDIGSTYVMYVEHTATATAAATGGVRVCVCVCVCVAQTASTQHLLFISCVSLPGPFAGVDSARGGSGAGPTVCTAGGLASDGFDCVCFACSTSESLRELPETGPLAGRVWLRLERLSSLGGDRLVCPAEAIRRRPCPLTSFSAVPLALAGPLFGCPC